MGSDDIKWKNILKLSKIERGSPSTLDMMFVSEN
jgi:hypothetical protein